MKINTPIHAFHLLNDFSGSPKVLMQLLKGWKLSGFELHLHTSLHRNGFLTEIEGVKYHSVWYRFAKNPLIRFLNYSLSQLLLFFSLLFKIKRGDIVYVNTVLPFGAALAGRVKGCRVIYHIHESIVRPRLLKWFLFSVVELTASDIVNVSQYVANSHGIKKKKNHLLYNAIEDVFIEQAQPKLNKELQGNVLMVCSLKAYKGVNEFVQLAKRFPQRNFRMVLNATLNEINTYFASQVMPKNIQIYDSQINMHPFYRWADVVVNLSRPDGWVETFGLTIIEGMAYGLPAIVPPIGGIVEVISEGETGYMVDSRNPTALDKVLVGILESKNNYQKLSENASRRILLFSENRFHAESIKMILGDR